MMKRSIIEYYAENERYKCGYCKKPDSNYSHGLWAHTMTVSDYQDLIDRGWRRSGKYCYKPSIDVICCPMYTIRCRALDFKPSKSQKKVLKRVNKFLMGQDDVSSGEKLKSKSCDDMTVDDIEAREQFIETTRHHQNINMDIPFIEEEGDPRNEKCHDIKNDKEIVNEPSTSGTLRGKEKPPLEFDEENYRSTKTTRVIGPDPAKSPCKKAKQLRKERMLEKLRKKGVDITSMDNNINKNKEKKIEDFINELPNEVKRKLEVKLVRTAPPSPEWLASSKETHQVYVKYQMSIHGDRPEKCTEPKFHDFLVHSPLLEEYSDVGPPCGYGSFHQQYWLEGKIIAVGVLDILPKCVSSVYFFYDPDYRNLTLGTYGALRKMFHSCGKTQELFLWSSPHRIVGILEIEFTRHLHNLCPDLKYYYMGFYIHSCQKMRYKGNYFPSDLLCPETYKWFPIKDCIPKLELVPNSRLDPDLDSIDGNFPTESDVNYIPVLYKGELMRYKLYRRKVGKKNEEFEEIQEYARLVGAKTAKTLIYVK